jgi:hypothetical protein
MMGPHVFHPSPPSEDFFIEMWPSGNQNFFRRSHIMPFFAETKGVLKIGESGFGANRRE